ncbi:hypothetical protein TVAG_458630 [Trichomonas vaginalis G3]|uniref:Vacuolar protein sorting 55 n=1 Tax=Trichomonas vaginalis (strain ATCC PRA-98 / G3) TaxID=412133 RepID=A2E668_TRIV3|nr:vacuolar protein sorting 55 family [Trichomonas vaginalis G3]EAY11791.1 hypothetical protein TVAG_458630 [Trichomonas vaginalis G3]KAI5534201.1 vacuolar protein sorting 55 family [Trichomonas vaginalis G3]|eukprot:XP_001324014.1 hypothetical protein [Trichomonas vaginalis G3]
MIQAAPYIVIGIFGTIALVLFIAGCAITKTWWPLFGIIPATLSCIFGVSLSTKLGDDYVEDTEGCNIFTADSVLFYLVCSVVSTIALNVVFWHAGTINKKCFGFMIGGDVAVCIGFVVFMILYGKTEDDGY